MHIPAEQLPAHPELTRSAGVPCRKTRIQDRNLHGNACSGRELFLNNRMPV